jgi:hypothetical protein
MLPFIQPISSYSNESAISGFLRDVFDMQPWGAAWKGRPDPDRLVVVKPNWVLEAHEHMPEHWEQVITHPVLVLSLVETLAERMEGVGTICLCDAPVDYADFEAIISRGNLKERLEQIKNRYPELGIELLDLRREAWTRKEGVVTQRRPNRRDPRGYVKVDLGRRSLFYGHRGEGSYYGADYDEKVVNLHHRGTIHEYLLAGSAVQCELLINMAKLKTHKKTGITCCLKNLVGINGDKNWLPHHTAGGPKTGGDEFPGLSVANRVEGLFRKAGMRMITSFPGVGPLLYRKMRNAGMGIFGGSRQVIRNGNWHGNDTCWRMVLDLNRALLIANPDETLQKNRQARSFLAIVDGIVGGQGDGPLTPDRVEANVLVAGDNPAEVDAACCKLMGFDPARIPLVREAFAQHPIPVSRGPMGQVRVFDQRRAEEIDLDAIEPALPAGFRPHFGWEKLNCET